MVTKTLSEKKTMEIFATPQKSKLGWFSTPNYQRRYLSFAAGLRRHFNESILRR